MKKIVVIIVVVVVGWYGIYSYKQDLAAFVQLNPSTDLLKCITKDGRVIYGKIPGGTVCERTQAVNGSVTVVPGEIPGNKESAPNSFSSSAKQVSNSVSGFKCDGRTFCSQMSSCEEAMYFLKHCPNTNMDGNNDGIPCEKQWCR